MAPLSLSSLVVLLNYGDKNTHRGHYCRRDQQSVRCNSPFQDNLWVLMLKHRCHGRPLLEITEIHPTTISENEGCLRLLMSQLQSLLEIIEEVTYIILAEVETKVFKSILSFSRLVRSMISRGGVSCRKRDASNKMICICGES